MIRIEKIVVEEMIDHALKDRPNEACGYLGGEDGTVVAAYRMKNIDESGEHFSLDPREQFAVVKTMRENGQKPAAVYHSHPATPARPSAEDLRLAVDPDITYIIVSLADGMPQVKAFEIKAGAAREEEIEIIEE